MRIERHDKRLPMSRKSMTSVLLDMSQGVPGVLPPRSLQDALKEALSQGSFGYYPANGEPALRKAPAQEMKHVADADVGIKDVALTAGCNMAFVAAVIVWRMRGTRSW